MAMRGLRERKSIAIGVSVGKVGPLQLRHRHRLWLGVSLCLWPCLLGFLWLFDEGEGGILAKSEIQKCVRTREKSDLKCRQKILVQLAVASGKDAAEDEMWANLDTVVNSSSGAIQTLEDPQRITVSKSDTYMAFPLEYVQSVNRKAIEEARRVEGCNAEDCWTDGRRHAIHWGFCCICNQWGRRSYTRNVNVGCKGAHNGPLFDKVRLATRSCLIYDPTWFPSYIVDLAVMTFTIKIEVSIGQNTILSTVILSPDDVHVRSLDGALIARLYGDLLSYKQFPVLNSVYLSLPQYDTTSKHPDYKIWSLIDRYQYSKDGRDCDKLGTSYEAFINVADRCRFHPGDCLRWQMEDYLKEDEERFRKGLRPRYSVLQYGTVGSERDSDRMKLLIRIDQSLNSIITLELRADSIQFRINRSPGKIIKIDIPTFEALSRNGVAHVTVENTGELIAGFTLRMMCPREIQTSPAITISLKPKQPQTYKFTLHTSNDRINDYNCKALLRDAEGEVVDQSVQYFSTSATKYVNGSKYKSVGASIIRMDKTTGILGMFSSIFGSIFGGIGSVAKKVFGGVFGGVFNIFKGFFSFLLSPLDWLRKLLDAMTGGIFGKIFSFFGSALSFVGFILICVAGFFVLKLLNDFGMLQPLCGLIFKLAFLPFKICFCVMGSLCTFSGNSNNDNDDDGDDEEEKKPKKKPKKKKVNNYDSEESEEETPMKKTKKQKTKVVTQIQPQIIQPQIIQPHIIQQPPQMYAQWHPQQMAVGMAYGIRGPSPFGGPMMY